MANIPIFLLKPGITELMAILSQTSKPVLICVAGGSCSGKTYFSEQLEREARQHNSVSIISLDYYFKDLDDVDFPKNNEGRRLFDVPNSYYQDEFRLHIGQLFLGQDIWTPDYNFESNKRIGSRGKLVLAGEIIIAEGLFVIAILNNVYPNVIKVYIEADENVRLERRIKRDTLLYQVSANKVIERFKSKVLPNHVKFVEPQKNYANIIIKSQEGGG